MSHTAGPWTIDFDEGNGFEIYAATPATLCVCKRGQHPRIPEVMAANARLIAAAPELLEALKLILTNTASGSTNHLCKRDEDRARAAIAKAEGK